MHTRQRFPNVIFGASLRPESAALAILVMLLFLIFVLLFITLTAQPAQAQTFNVIHTFTGAKDGGFPSAGLTLDKGGNLYGTASGGGTGYGTVYQLKHKGSNLVFNPLYSFAGGTDGNGPAARVMFGPNGTLYGTTVGGGNGYGTIFNLRPSPRACTTALCPWTETVLYRFTEGAGGWPVGDLVFDQAGNIYGTTYLPGGVVYELTPSGGGWTESVLYSFSGSDGQSPESGLIFDSAGNLYGTTYAGGLSGVGTVFEMSPLGGGWTEKVLYSFQGGSDGAAPFAGLIFDPSGNLYGATSNGGQGGGGTVFKLTPSGGSWTYSLIYSFAGNKYNYCGPLGTLVMDGVGNLYGTTYCDGAYGLGNVFKLTPSGNSWTYTSLHDFTFGSDGGAPICNVVFDANGNLYGTTRYGGDNQDCGPCGVVWEITP